MLDKYYKDRYFLLALLVFLLITSQSFGLWYTQQATSDRPFAWVALLLLFVINTVILFFPSKQVHLPKILLPFVLLLTLWIQQLAFSSLPHNITIKASLWPMLVMLLTAVGLILRHHAVAAWVTFFMGNILRLNWHSDFYAPSTNVALFFFVPATILVSAQIIITQVDVFQLKAEESEGLLKNAEDKSVKQQGVSFTAERRVKEVRELAETMLHRIAYDPAPVTQEEIRDFRFAEAQLRDTIRGRYIVNEQILQATWAARKRGAQVDILDERGEPLPKNISKMLTESAVDLLDEVSSGTVTIRAFPKDDLTAVMLVHDPNNDSDEGMAIEISQDGVLERF